MLAFDTNIVIYALESHPQFGEAAREVLRKAATGSVASVLVYTEALCKVNPAYPSGAVQAKGILDNLKGVTFQEVTKTIAMEAAVILAHNNSSLRLPDAVHLATAVVCGARVFWTNDHKLQTVKVAGLRIKTLELH